MSSDTKATGLSNLGGTRWAGKGELWLDPLHNEAHRYDCTLSVEPTEIRYTWSHEGKQHEGKLTLAGRGAVWTDTWHQPTAVECTPVADSWALLAVRYSFPVPGGPDWGWRIGLSQRPTGELVLQMTVIKPWGEEGRAVRMVLTRKT
jgi:hypothetical protein